MLTQPMLGLLLSAALISCASGGVQQKERANADASTIAEFTKRVEAYVALHKKLEATIPTLPKEASPQQIDQHQRALGRLIADARRSAKRGDIFTPGMEQIA